jgi:cell division protein FtsB
MSLGLHESARRRRRQRQWATLRVFLIVALLAGLGWFSYVIGQEFATAEVEALRQQLTEARDRTADLERENARLAGEAATIRQTAGNWRERYENDVPSGEMAALLSLARQRLAEGLSPARLAFVVGNAREPKACSDEPVTKRFLVRTPIYRGANDSVSFADGLITLSASGEAATDANGRPEAWFDTAQPIRIQVDRAGGERQIFDGELPLSFAIIRQDTEHRFAARPGERRGFLQVTEQRCPYP